MEQLRYDGQVAIVTGVGRGLGRSYARILAARGAKVIVNDLGGSTTGGGKSSDLAEAVVGDIMALGGEAIADAGDVTDPSTAQRLVALALDRWGRVDIVINNAGSIAPDVTQSFAEMELAQFDHQMQIHAYAPFHLVHAAWPAMLRQQYGRIVCTLSDSMFGMGGGAGIGYPVAKMAIMGFVRALAMEGAPHGITCNAISPAAFTRLVAMHLPDSDIRDWMEKAATPERVASVVAWLVHRDATCTGQSIAASSGRFAKIVTGFSKGYAGGDLTIEEVRDHFDEAIATDHIDLIENTGDAIALYLSALKERRLSELNSPPEWVA